MARENTWVPAHGVLRTSYVSLIAKHGKTTTGAPVSVNADRSSIRQFSYHLSNFCNSINRFIPCRARRARGVYPPFHFALSYRRRGIRREFVPWTWILPRKLEISRFLYFYPQRPRIRDEWRRRRAPGASDARERSRLAITGRNQSEQFADVRDYRSAASQAARYAAIIDGGTILVGIQGKERLNGKAAALVKSLAQRALILIAALSRYRNETLGTVSARVPCPRTYVLFASRKFSSGRCVEADDTNDTGTGTGTGDTTEIRHDRFCIGTYNVYGNTAQPVRAGKSPGHKSRMQPFFYPT